MPNQEMPWIVLYEFLSDAYLLETSPTPACWSN
jgi:hypothetical protein